MKSKYIKQVIFLFLAFALFAPFLIHQEGSAVQGFEKEETYRALSANSFFTKITDEVDLVSGARYVISANNNEITYVASSHQSAAALARIDATLLGSAIQNDNNTSNLPEVYELEVHDGETSKEYRFKVLSSVRHGYYLGVDGTKITYFDTGQTVATLWKIDMTHEMTIITSSAHPLYGLQLNKNLLSKEFNVYSTPHLPINLALDYSSLTTSDEALIARGFSQEVNEGVGLNVRDNCLVAYTYLNARFDELGLSAQTMIMTSTEGSFHQAYLRFNYLALATNVMSPEFDLVKALTAKEPPIMETILIGILALSVLFAYAYLEKRKK